MTLSISQDVWDKYYEAADFFITEFGENCTIYYPPLKVECVNCTTGFFNSISKNVYKHGGPAPFNFGNCPLCGGNGYAEQESTTDIRLRIYWTKKDWVKVSDAIIMPDAEVQIIGYLTDLTKLRRADYIKLVTVQKELESKYVLTGECFFWGFKKDRYFVGYLKKR